MFNLSLQQTDLVARYVKRKEVHFSHLGDDLVDHICCDLERLMSDGADFKDAFNQVKRCLGPKGLTHIQEETLFAVDLKYRNMKRLMKISGIIGTVMVGIGTMMKIQHWPLAGLLLTLGAFILVFLLLPSSLMVLWKESKSGKRLYLFTSGFIASALFIAGVLFKIQHWPGAGIAQSLGIATAVFLFLPAFVSRIMRDNDNELPRWLIFTGVLVVALYGIGLLMKIMHWPGASITYTLSTIVLAFLFIPAYFRSRWKDSTVVSIESMFLLFVLVMFIVPATLLNLDREMSFESVFRYTAQLNRKGIDFRMERNADLAGSFAPGNPEYEQISTGAAKLLNEINRIESILLPEEIDGEAITVSVESGHPFLMDRLRVEMLLNSEPDVLRNLESNFSHYIELCTKPNEVESTSTNTGISTVNFFPPDLVLYGGQHAPPVVIIHTLEILKGMVLDLEASALRKMKNESNL